MRLAALVTRASTRLTAWCSRTSTALWSTLFTQSLVHLLAGLSCPWAGLALALRLQWPLALLALPCRRHRLTACWRLSCLLRLLAALASSALGLCLRLALCLGVLVWCTSTLRLLLSSLCVPAVALRARLPLLAVVTSFATVRGALVFLRFPLQALGCLRAFFCARLALPSRARASLACLCHLSRRPVLLLHRLLSFRGARLALLSLSSLRLAARMAGLLWS